MKLLIKKKTNEQNLVTQTQAKEINWCKKGFLQALRFPPSSKLTPSLFQFDGMQDLAENHFRVRGASWVNIINYYFIFLNANPTVLKGGLYLDMMGEFVTFNKLEMPLNYMHF